MQPIRLFVGTELAETYVTNAVRHKNVFRLCLNQNRLVCRLKPQVNRSPLQLSLRLKSTAVF